jgi:hypothetical protein
MRHDQRDAGLALRQHPLDAPPDARAEARTALAGSLLQQHKELARLVRSLPAAPNDQPKSRWCGPEREFVGWSRQRRYV